jgi:diguanylate cyclase (GGDEF)-like protein/PAS domain S-box-containing protein
VAQLSPDRSDLLRALSLVPDATFLFDAGGVIRWANERCGEVLGWGLDDILGANVLDFAHPDDAALVVTSMSSIREKGTGSPTEVRCRSALGEWRSLEFVGRDLLGDEDFGGILCTARDLTDRRRWEVAAGDDARIQRVIQHVPTVVALLDADGVITSANGALTRLLGEDPSWLVGRRLAAFAADEREACRLGEAIASTTSTAASGIEILMQARVDGRQVPMRFEVVNLLDDPVVEAVAVTGHDITELHEVRRRLEHLATHDTLTDLPNRPLLAARLGELLTDGRPLALLYVDLDRFKPINDRFGHGTGDEVLRRVADRLRASVTPSDVVARVGGDEFVVLAVGVSEPADAAALADRIRERLGAPYELAVGTVVVGASVGAAIAGAGLSAEELLDAADTAMYTRKAGEAR